jgi:AraC-like DNA-binding protein
MKKHVCEGSMQEITTILHEDEESVSYRVHKNDGEILLKENCVFPGVWLIYQEVSNLQNYCYPKGYPKGLLEIAYCRKGGFEYDSKDCFFYLSKGDISVHESTDAADIYYPTRHYEGITVIIDLDLAPECLTHVLDDIHVRPAHLKQKFCGENNYHIIRTSSQLENIFSQLYQVPNTLERGYYKVKVLELLLILDNMDPEEKRPVNYNCTQNQRQLAKQVCDYINDNLDSRPTIDELAATFYVSPAQLKKCFYSVYGESIYAYIKAYKMRVAALRLETTEDSVSQLSDAFGYDNSSKFSQAFRSVMGMSPTQYRQSVRLEQ